MRNEVYSASVDLIKWTVNCSARKEKIRIITPHCTAVKANGLVIASRFCDPAQKVSANYIIGRDCELVANVPENKRAWTSSSAWNDQRAITIECASGNITPYEFCDGVYDKLVKLSADILNRYGYNRLVYLGSLDATKNALENADYSDAMFVTLHKWYANKQCPGMWFIHRISEYCDLVTERVSGQLDEKTGKLYRVQIGAYKDLSNATRMASNLKMLGYDAIIV